jgi:hypothetical protein
MTNRLRLKQVNGKTRRLARMTTVAAIAIVFLAAPKFPSKATVPLLPHISTTAFADNISIIVTIDSATPTVIPLPGVHVGDSIFFNVFLHTIDPFETEGPLVMQSSGGFFRVFADYEQHTLGQFTATKDGETITAFIRGADGDEKAIINLMFISTCDVQYDGATNCSILDSGFDKTTDPNMPWLSVAVDQTTGVANAIITSSHPTDVTFKSADTSKAIVSPAQATFSPQPLQVTGLSPGETMIQASVGSQNTSCSLNVAVFDTSTVNVAVHIITPARRPNQPAKGCPSPTPNTTQKALNAALNNIWDQAAIRFNITKFEQRTLDFDFNGDCKLNIPASGPANELTALLKGLPDLNPAEVNIFYVHALDVEGRSLAGATIPKLKISIIQDAHPDTTERLTAHEIGHSLGLEDVDDSTRLMFGESRATNPCILIKPEWVTTNKKAGTFSHGTSQNVGLQDKRSPSDNAKAQEILSEIEEGNSARLEEFLAMRNRAIPALQERLKDSRPSIRENALQLLGRIDIQDDGVLNQDQVIDAMVDAITGSEPSREIVHTALWYLSAIAPNKVSPAMMQGLLLQLHNSQPLAARILGQVGDASLRPVLEPYLSSKDKALAELTRQALAKLGDPRCLSEIVAELDSQDVQVRSDAFEKLAYIRSRNTVRKIAHFLWNTDALASPSPDVWLIPYRYLAADALSRIVNKPPLKKELYEWDDEDIRLWQTWWESHQQEYP